MIDDKPMIFWNMRMPRHIKRDIETIARRRSVAASAIVRVALSAYIARTQGRAALGNAKEKVSL